MMEEYRDLVHLIDSESEEEWKRDILRTLENVHEGSEYPMVMRDGILEGGIPIYLKYKSSGFIEQIERAVAAKSKKFVLKPVKAAMDSNIGMSHFSNISVNTHWYVMADSPITPTSPFFIEVRVSEGVTITPPTFYFREIEVNECVTVTMDSSNILILLEMDNPVVRPTMRQHSQFLKNRPFLGNSNM